MREIVVGQDHEKQSAQFSSRPSKVLSVWMSTKEKEWHSCQKEQYRGNRHEVTEDGTETSKQVYNG